MRKLFYSLTCLLVFSLDTRAQEDNYSFTETFKISEPAQLVISSDDGDIEILPSGGDRIEVNYIVKRNNKLLKIGRTELEKEVTLKAISSVSSLNISVKYLKNVNLYGNYNNITVSFKIHVPKQTACYLKTSDGNISVTGLISNQDLNTKDGNIHASDIKGSVKGFTSDGDIMAKATRGSVDFKSGDGNISLEDIVGNAFASTGDGNIKAIKIRGDLTLKTSDGHIEFQSTEGSVTAITEDGNIKGNIIELRRKLSLEAGDGNIEVIVPDRLGLDLDIRGSSIHTPLKNFSGKQGQDYIQGQLNGGGIPVKLKVFEGDIKLSYK